MTKWMMELHAQEELQSLIDTANTLGMEGGANSEGYANCESGVQTENLDGWEDLLEKFRAANNLPEMTKGDLEDMDENSPPE